MLELLMNVVFGLVLLGIAGAIVYSILRTIWDCLMIGLVLCIPIGIGLSLYFYFVPAVIIMVLLGSLYWYVKYRLVEVEEV